MSGDWFHIVALIYSEMSSITLNIVITWSQQWEVEDKEYVVVKAGQDKEERPEINWPVGNVDPISQQVWLYRKIVW